MRNWMRNYDEEIRGKMEWVAVSFLQDIEKAKTICAELIQYGNEKQDNQLIAFSYYSLANLLYNLSDYPEAIHNAEIGYGYVRNAHLPKLEIVITNLIGCIYMQSSSMDVSLDYFMKGLRISEENQFYYHMGLCYANIGSIFSELDDQKTAIQFLKKGYDSFIQYQESELIRDNAAFMNLLIIGNSYLMLHQPELAMTYINKARVLQKTGGYPEEEYVSFYLVLSMYEQQMHHEEERMKYLDQYVEHFFTCSGVSDRVMEVITFAQMLDEENDKAALAKIRPILDQFVKMNISNGQLVQILKIQWHQMEDQTSAEAVEILQKILIAQSEKERVENQFKVISLKSQIDRHQSYVKMDRLADIASKDSLTELYNRRYFEEIFSTVEKNETIGIGMIDFDYFKEYNDNYGHLAGDQALRQIAKVFVSQADDHMTFARYGGDEFIFLAKDITYEELEKRVQIIIREIHALKIAHLYSKSSNQLTISIGVTFHLSLQEKDFNRMVKEADELLYQVKNHNRGGYRILEQEN